MGKLIARIHEVCDKANSYSEKDPMNSFIIFTVMQNETTEERFLGNGETEYLEQTEIHSDFIDELNIKIQSIESRLNENQVKACLEHVENGK